MEPQIQLHQPSREWPVIDPSLEAQKRRQTAPARRYRLLQGHYVVQVQIGVDLKGEPVLEDRRYQARTEFDLADYTGDIVKSTDDLCKLYNGGGRNAQYRKFELIPEGEPDVPDYVPEVKFVWNPKEETIEQFLARTAAQVPA
jgi:hypothetical protein